VSVDLFTFAAQIVNFVVLVLLLRHFLYKRIVRVMDEREAAISRRIEDARKEKEKAQEEEKSFREKRKELEDREDELVSQAESQAEDRKQTLLREAREEVERAQERWRDSLQAQKESFLSDFRQRAGEHVFETARRVLRDLADEDLERRIVEVFLRRLEGLDEDTKREIRKTVESSKGEVAVVSRFKIPEKWRQKVDKAVKDIAGSGTRATFRTAEGLLGGIELEVRDRKIAWEIDNYLGDLTEKMAEAFEQRISEEREAEEGTEKKAEEQEQAEAGKAGEEEKAKAAGDRKAEDEKEAKQAKQEEKGEEENGSDGEKKKKGEARTKKEEAKRDDEETGGHEPGGKDGT